VSGEAIIQRRNIWINHQNERSRLGIFSRVSISGGYSRRYFSELSAFCTKCRRQMVNPDDKGILLLSSKVIEGKNGSLKDGSQLCRPLSERRVLWRRVKKRAEILQMATLEPDNRDFG
jgi:Fe-S cluster assembly ATPase SufC